MNHYLLHVYIYLERLIPHNDGLCLTNRTYHIWHTCATKRFNRFIHRAWHIHTHTNPLFNHRYISRLSMQAREGDVAQWLELEFLPF